MELTLNWISKNYLYASRHSSLLEQWRDKQKTKRDILQNISLTVRPGEKILLTGRNGAGKTTLLKIAAGLVSVDSGTVTKAESPGLMLTHQFLYSLLTGKQNLEHSARLYGCRDAEERINEQNACWGLAPFLHQRVLQYSNGQKTLLALARANVHKPSLLLLDEPLVFLDLQGRQRFLRFLKDSSQAIVLTAQESGDYDGLVDRVVPL
jgi:ABC-type multidrug transport system ATPase subunit